MPKKQDSLFELIGPGYRTGLKPFEFGDFPLLVHTMSHDGGTDVLHSHNCVEMVYVRSGRGTHIVGDRAYELYPGDCFVLQPGEKHGFGRKTRLTLTNFMFHPRLVRPYRDELFAVPGFVQFFSLEPLFRAESAFRYKLHLPSGAQREFTAIADKLEHEYVTRRDGARLCCTCLFVELLVLLSRSYHEALSRERSVDHFSHQKSIVDAAIAYLEQNYAKSLRVRDVAYTAYVSPSHLTHLFTEVTGWPLNEYLIGLRIDQACLKLRSSSVRVADIAREVGFDDPAYCSRLFRKRTGHSPIQFRATARG